MSNKLFKFAAVILIISGCLNLLTEVLNLLNFDSVVFIKSLNFIGASFAIWGMLGLFLKRAKILGTLGLVFFSIYSVGLAGIVGFLFSDAFVLSLLDEAKVSELTNSTTGLAIFASIILYVFGLVSFGVYSAIKKAYPKAPILIYSLGSLITPFAMALPYFVVNLVETAASASVVYLGFWLWKNFERENR